VANLKRKKKKEIEIDSFPIRRGNDLDFLSQEKGRTGGEGEQKRNNTVIVRSVTRVCMCARLDTRVEKVREKIGTAKKSAII